MVLVCLRCFILDMLPKLHGRGRESRRVSRLNTLHSARQLPKLRRELTPAMMHRATSTMPGQAVAAGTSHGICRLTLDLGSDTATLLTEYQQPTSLFSG